MRLSAPEIQTCRQVTPALLMPSIAANQVGYQAWLVLAYNVRLEDVENPALQSGELTNVF